jgi:hypothetical protein
VKCLATILVALGTLVGCGGATTAEQPGPPRSALPPTDCFGDATYLVARTYDPKASTITEHRAGSFGTDDVVMDVTLGAETATFTIRGGPSGTGTLEGPAWAWTSWYGEFHADETSSMTTASTIDEAGLHTQSEIHAGGSHSMGAPEDYPRFACSELAVREAAVPR